MKIRNGFVSNSSSSSFLIDGYDLTDLYQSDEITYYKVSELLDEFNEEHKTDFEIVSDDSDLFVGNSLHCGDNYGSVDLSELTNTSKDLNKLKEFLKEKGYKTDKRLLHFGEISY